MSGVKLAVATDADMERVWRLTYDVYLQTGLCAANGKGLLLHYPHLDGIPETSVFIAHDDYNLLGTNTLTLDGPRKLHTDVEFPTETQAVREECQVKGRKLASSWRIVTHPGCRNKVRVVLGLIHLTIRTALRQGVDTVLFTFHPDHARIYERLVGCWTIAGPIPCKTVLGSPAMLMRVDRERLRWRDVFVGTEWGEERE